MSFKEPSKSNSNNKHYDGQMTPSYPYTPTPTSESTLPYNTPEASCKTTFQHLKKDNFKPNKRLDISGAFPFFQPSEFDSSPIQIISESPDDIQPLPPSTNYKHQEVIMVNNNNQNNEETQEQEQKINLKDLKITIPTANDHTKRRSNSNKRSRKFSLIDTDDEILADSMENATLSLHGYQKQKFVAKTLQGHIITAILTGNEEEKEAKTVIIKTSNKELHSKRITIQKHGKKYKIEEDIIKEAELMKKFMSCPHPSALIEYYDFFEDKENYYIVMEKGGSDLFDFIVKCHKLISSKKLSLKEWRKHYKFMFAQMVLFMGWMHRVQHCCHLDISLENMLICDGVKITENEDDFKLNQCYIKFIDFGLSEFFDGIMNPCFLCNKFVGKPRYKAPEVYRAKGTFRADKADIWSLGVVLFMLAVGSPPYNKPIDHDIAFKYIKCGRITDLLQSWNRLNYITPNLHDLLKQMLCTDASKRISIENIMQHPWIRVYFSKKDRKISTNAMPSNTNV